MQVQPHNLKYVTTRSIPVRTVIILQLATDELHNT